MTGTVLVDHACPQCGHTSSAPLRGVYDGPVGIWCCEQCDGAFRVSIRLEPIEPSGHRQRVEVRERFDRLRGAMEESDIEESDVDADSETDRQRLLELCGESLYLEGRLHDLQSEIARLSEQRCLPVGER